VGGSQIVKFVEVFSLESTVYVAKSIGSSMLTLHDNVVKDCPPLTACLTTSSHPTFSV
jgi:hypothetical protein